jgi:hypothetical protein
MKGRGNYSDASKGEDDVECVITTGPAPARQGFHLYSKILTSMPNLQMTR